MTKGQRLYTGASRGAWGYFFLYFNVNFGTINMLPDFVGWMLFLSAIGHLEEERRDLTLLRPLAQMLAVWNFIDYRSPFGFTYDQSQNSATQRS